jgi:hypothetical protein
MTTVRRIIAPLCAVAGLCSGAAAAAPDCSAAPVLTPLQKRITSAAGEGVEPLRASSRGCNRSMGMTFELPWNRGCSTTIGLRRANVLQPAAVWPCLQTA